MDLVSAQAQLDLIDRPASFRGARLAPFLGDGGLRHRLSQQIAVLDQVVPGQGAPTFRRGRIGDDPFQGPDVQRGRGSIFADADFAALGPIEHFQIGLARPDGIL